MWSWVCHTERRTCKLREWRICNEELYNLYSPPNIIWYWLVRRTVTVPSLTTLKGIFVHLWPTAFEHHDSRECASIGNSWFARSQVANVSAPTALLWDVYLSTLILVGASFSAYSAQFSYITRRQYQKTKISSRERGSLKSHYIAQLHIYLLVIRAVLRWYSCGRHGCVRARMSKISVCSRD